MATEEQLALTRALSGLRLLHFAPYFCLNYDKSKCLFTLSDDVLTILHTAKVMDLLLFLS
jgi:hypothetical protein